MTQRRVGRLGHYIFETIKETQEQASQDIFDEIEIFYNPKRKHERNHMLTPVDFESRQQTINDEGV